MPTGSCERNQIPRALWAVWHRASTYKPMTRKRMRPVLCWLARHQTKACWLTIKTHYRVLNSPQCEQPYAQRCTFILSAFRIYFVYNNEIWCCGYLGIVESTSIPTLALRRIDTTTHLSLQVAASGGLTRRISVSVWGSNTTLYTFLIELGARVDTLMYFCLARRVTQRLIKASCTNPFAPFSTKLAAGEWYKPRSCNHLPRVYLKVFRTILCWSLRYITCLSFLRMRAKTGWLALY